MKNTHLRVVRSNASNLKFKCAMGIVPHVFTWQGAKGNWACIHADCSPYPVWPARLVGAGLAWILIYHPLLDCRACSAREPNSNKPLSGGDTATSSIEARMKRRLSNLKFALEVWTLRYKHIANARRCYVIKPASVTIKQWYSLFGGTQLMTRRNELR